MLEVGLAAKESNKRSLYTRHLKHSVSETRLECEEASERAKKRHKRVWSYCNLQIFGVVLFSVFSVVIGFTEIKRHLNAKNTLSDHDSIHGHRNLNYTECCTIARHRSSNAPKICKITVSTSAVTVHAPGTSGGQRYGCAMVSLHRHCCSSFFSRLSVDNKRSVNGHSRHCGCTQHPQ